MGLQYENTMVLWLLRDNVLEQRDSMMPSEYVHRWYINILLQMTFLEQLKMCQEKI